MNKLALTLLALLGLAISATPSRANTITPTLAGIPSMPGVWTYTADLTSGEMHAGDGFTIFDFAGYVAGSITAPVNWVASVVAFGSPYGVPLGIDSPEMNLTFTYTGATVIMPFALNLGLFTATTTAPEWTIDNWTSSDHVLFGGGAISHHTDNIVVPAPDGGSAIALLGVALMGLEGLRRLIRPTIA